MVERLECLPDGLLGVVIDGYRIEVVELAGKVVQKLKIIPQSKEVA